MSLPEPLPGLVIRYSYLWARHAARGLVEAEKSRPAAVVMTIAGTAKGPSRVCVLPITHSQPDDLAEALEIPASVRRAAGLDAAPSWIILSEFNDFAWPGFDLSPIPERRPSTVAYGFLTSGFFSKVRDRWLALDAARKTTAISRDE